MTLYVCDVCNHSTDERAPHKRCPLPGCPGALLMEDTPALGHRPSTFVLCPHGRDSEHCAACAVYRQTTVNLTTSIVANVVTVVLAITCLFVLRGCA